MLRCQHFTPLDPPGVNSLTLPFCLKPPAQIVPLCQSQPHRCCCAPVQLWDASGAEVSSKICKILGGEGGFADRPKNWPSDGLLTDVAYRWDVVRPCSNLCVAPLQSVPLSLSSCAETFWLVGQMASGAFDRCCFSHPPKGAAEGRMSWRPS